MATVGLYSAFQREQWPRAGEFGRRITRDGSVASLRPPFSNFAVRRRKPVEHAPGAATVRRRTSNSSEQSPPSLGGGVFSRDGAAVKSRVDVVSRGPYFSGAYLDGCRPHDPKPDIHCSRSDRLSRTMATSAGLRRDAGALWAKSVISQKSPGHGMP